MKDDDGDSHTTMDSHTMDFPIIDSRIVHRGPPPEEPQGEIVWSSSDSGRSSYRSAEGRGRAPGTGTPSTIRRRKRRETAGGDQFGPAEDTARSGGPRAHLSAEDTSDWSEKDQRNGEKRGQLIGGGGPAPAHRASPDPYAMSPDDEDDISSDDDEDDPPKTQEDSALPTTTTAVWGLWMTSESHPRWRVLQGRWRISSCMRPMSGTKHVMMQPLPSNALWTEGREP
jgi:hypothetical protein